MTDESNSGSEAGKTYQLDCTGCSFERTIEGDLDQAYDLIDDHEAKYDGVDERHFVNLELIDSPD